MQQQRFRRLAIAPGTADLLVIGFGAAGHVHMRHETHVGPVDAHAEGDRGNHHHRLPGAEARQAGAFFNWRQPRMKRHGLHAVALQHA